MVPTLLRNLTVYKAYTQGAGEEGEETALQREWKCSVTTIGLITADSWFLCSRLPHWLMSFPFIRELHRQQFSSLHFAWHLIVYKALEHCYLTGCHETLWEQGARVPGTPGEGSGASRDHVTPPGVVWCYPGHPGPQLPPSPHLSTAIPCADPAFSPEFPVFFASLAAQC